MYKIILKDEQMIIPVVESGVARLESSRYHFVEYGEGRLMTSVIFGHALNLALSEKSYSPSMIRLLMSYVERGDLVPVEIDLVVGSRFVENSGVVFLDAFEDFSKQVIAIAEESFAK